jgi:hypothetical protein
MNSSTQNSLVESVREKPTMLIDIAEIRQIYCFRVKIELFLVDTDQSQFIRVLVPIQSLYSSMATVRRLV